MLKVLKGIVTYTNMFILKVKDNMFTSQKGPIQAK